MKIIHFYVTKNNIKNMIISITIFVASLLLFLVIGLRLKINVGGSVTEQIFVGFNHNSYNEKSQFFGLDTFDKINQLGVNTNTSAIFPAIILILFFGIINFIFSLIVFLLKEQYRITKIIFDLTSKVFFLLIIVFSTVIIVQFTNYVRDFQNQVIPQAKVQTNLLTSAFLVIFCMILPFIAIAISFNKKSYITKK